MGSVALLVLAVATAAMPDVPPSLPPQPQPLVIDLRLEAPDECPDVAALGEEIIRFAGPIERRADGVAVRGRIERTGGGWALELELGTSPPEHRRVEAHDCVVLVRAAALMVAVTLEPVATSTRIGPGIEPVEAPVAATERAEEPTTPPRLERGPTPREQPRVATVAPRPKARVQLVMAAYGGVGLGFAPRITGIVHGEVGLGMPRVRVMFGGVHGFARNDRIASGVGIRAQTSAATLHALAQVDAGPLGLELGGGVEAGAVVGAGTGRAVAAKTARAPWVAVTGRIGATWPPRGPIAFTARVDALVAAVRPGIELQGGAGPQTVFRTPLVSIRGLAGLLVRLP